MNGVTRIPSMLYFDLWTKGNELPGLTGDKLIAVYSILKSAKNKEIKYYAYKSKNNKKISGYSLLRAKTNLSLHVIEKYVPILIEMGLCFIDYNGDFVLLGNQKVKDLYNSYKLVPIKVGKNLSDTSNHVLMVRGFSSDKKQQIQYSKKLTRSEIILQGADPKTYMQLKRANNVYKRYGEVTNLNEKTVLSVQGFGVIKHGEKNSVKDLKSSGCYWKRKLKSKGLIETERQFEKIEKMSYSYYIKLRKLGILDRNQLYRKGYLVKELISTFKPVDLISVSIVETVEEITFIKESGYNKKSYLQFDMLDFWTNGSK